VNACHPWLDAEIQLVKPRVIVCLGATAAQTMLGRQFRLTKERGIPIAYSEGTQIVATIHPSAILRAPEQDARHEEYLKLVADLKKVRTLL
jgi:DNA polymerase